MSGWSWSETRALATRAATGAGIPHAQARLYGASACRHLAAGGDPAALTEALTHPELLTQALTDALIGGTPTHPLAQAMLATDTKDQPRLTVPDTLKDAWSAHAAATYVPESATSRAGAGGAEAD
ncbi:MAG: hypothetical protein AAGF60_13450 [Pseudomonadota bacterium]